MMRSKKFVLVTTLAAVVLVGSITGAVLAQNGDDSQPEARHWALLERACEIYEDNTGVAIDSEALKDAFAQARSEMRAKALQTRLQYLVEQGTITQDEADQYTQWWESKPDVPLRFGFRARCGPLGGGGLQAPQPAE
jgi:hypothetical protein